MLWRALYDHLHLCPLSFAYVSGPFMSFVYICVLCLWDFDFSKGTLQIDAEGGNYKSKGLFRFMLKGGNHESKGLFRSISEVYPLAPSWDGARGISGDMGLVSAGRIDKDTPPLTTPSHTSKSSTMDISPHDICN
jgi:hypothetical protein